MKTTNFNKILVANRGEIASRIIKAIKKLGMTAVAIYSEIDKNMPFVQQADEVWSLGKGSIQDTYLNKQKIIELARKSSSNAIHPGYGFLSENAEFSKLCASNSIVFIGPSVEVIDLMGNKSNARETAKKYKVPVIEGITGNAKDILKKASSLDFPVLIKPAAGGGGKGMQIVNRIELLEEALIDASREALNYFGSDDLYLEKYIEKARHIEVQVLGDHHGNVIHLFERECTVQRRYQKIIEEAPAASISEALREQITNSAILLCKGINYTSAGTIEYLVDEQEGYYFIEMNTRIQVEHPVTEMITGIDIVSEQIKIAEGKAIEFKQSELKISGHSIEARIYAENPNMDFMPASGQLRKLEISKLDCRLDNGYDESNSISSFYDPMLAKMVVLGKNRNDAIQLLVKGLKDYHLSGFTTNREFLLGLLQTEDFVKNNIYTKYIDTEINNLLEKINGKRNKFDKSKLLVIASLLFLTAKDETSQNDESIWTEIGHWRQQADIQLKLEEENFRIPYSKDSSNLLFNFKLNSKEFEASILDKHDNFFHLLINGEQFHVWIDINISEISIDLDQHTFSLRRTDIPDHRYIGKTRSENKADSNEVLAPLNGKIVKINKKKNDSIKSGDTLMVIESMKMENKIIAEKDAVIENINVKLGELVELDKLLLIYK